MLVINLAKLTSSIPTEDDDQGISADYYADLYDTDVPDDSEVKNPDEVSADERIDNFSEDQGDLSNDYEFMDHSHHGGHSMAMSFNFNLNVEYLFSSLKITTNTHLFLYCILTVLLGMVIEYKSRDYRKVF